MKIKFNQDCQLEVTTGFDEETETAETQDEIFVFGEVIECEVVSVNPSFKTSEIQFCNGHVAYGVPWVYFEVIEL